MIRQKKRRNRIIIGLISILLLMTVGYAAYNTNLNITGTSNISNSWDIEITKISDPVLTGSAKHVASEIGSDKLSASMEADLYDKGDSAEYTATIENKGSVDAVLDSITKDTSNSNENIDITFSNYAKGQRLESGKTIDIKVKIAYPSDTAFNTNIINNNIKLMSTNTLATGEAKITFNFKQAEGYKDSEDYPIPNTYLVEYDCTTNGGKDCSEFNEYLKGGESVNLTNNPGNNKDDGEFIGWNTDKDATEEIGSLSVTNETINENNKITLYAIYEGPLSTPTFLETIEEDKTIVTINYQEECGSKYTCKYKIDDGQFQIVTTTTKDVEFTDSGTVTAVISKDTKEASSSYTITYTKTSGTEKFNFKNEVQTFTAPETGDYLLEVWGAQGGSYNTTYAGGKGGYSYGTVTLNKGDNLYIYTGGQGTGSGTSTTGIVAGGYNGGGAGYSSSTSYLCSAGGGASDIRINEDSLNARVIVAGGGGGSCSYSTSYRYSGGAGGGTTGIAGSQYSTSYLAGLGGTQTSKGTSYYGTTADSTSNGTPADFGIGGSAGTASGVAGGGAGWYGGGYARRASGGGGSGYVYTEDTDENKPASYTLDAKYHLTDAETIAGNQPFKSPTGEDETGHSGDGYAKITYNISANKNLSISANPSIDTITVTATTDLTNITKYEFKINDNDWIDNETTNTYEFTNLTPNTSYTLKVRITDDGSKTITKTKNIKTNSIPLKITTTKTTSTITAVATLSENEKNNITKYEFSKDGNTWVDNGTTNTYTFTNLNHNQTYTIYVRVTYKEITTITNSTSVTTAKINTPTFSDTTITNGKKVTITYPSITINGETISNICASSGNYTCQYSTNSGSSWTTVTTSTKALSYTTAGTYNIIAKITDKTYSSNVVTTSTHTITVQIPASSYLTTLATTDSTLITDDYENIRYSGKNVNNYVCIANETTCSDYNLYRIIGVFKNIKTTEEGTGETRIKLIKATNNGNAYWDTFGYNNWERPATLNTTLQSLSTVSKYVSNAVWNIGGYYTSNVTTKNMYNYERGTTVYTGRPTTWVGTVALMYPSDYGYASSSCKDSSNIANYGASKCTGSNWLFLGSDEWLLTPNSDYPQYALNVNSGGGVVYNSVVSDNSYAVRPTFYLKSSVSLVTNDGRDGSSSKPYLLQ